MTRACRDLTALTLAVAAVVFTIDCTVSRNLHLDLQSREFYKYARLIMTGIEKDIFSHLPDKKSREEFITDFWAKRDPVPSTEENEFKEEFYSRIEYANRHLREGIPGWKTDRGRIYIYLGPPDKIEMRPWINDPSIKGLIWWGYYRYRLAIEFVDTTGSGRYSLSRQAGASGGLLGAIERAKFGVVNIDNPNFQKVLKNFSLKYDTQKQEIQILLPVESLTFESDQEQLKADFNFDFFIYSRQEQEKDHFSQPRSFVTTEKDLMNMKEIPFSFSHAVASGSYYIDVIVTIKPDIGKVRKIFKIKISS